MCQEWFHFKNSVHDLPPEETELTTAAVGQAQPLLRIKLIQFHDLINIHEKSLAGETEKPVTILDLQVSWDTVQMQDQNTVISRHTPYPTRGILPSLRHKMMFHVNITHYPSLHTRP